MVLLIILLNVANPGLGSFGQEGVDHEGRHFDFEVALSHNRLEHLVGLRVALDHAAVVVSHATGSVFGNRHILFAFVNMTRVSIHLTLVAEKEALLYEVSALDGVLFLV